MVDCTAMILAGGFGRRMNYQNKALLKFKNSSFIEIALNNISRFNERLIVTRNIDDFNYPGVRTIADVSANQGPLCGLYSGLIEAKHNISVVVSVDTPFVKPELLVRLSELCQSFDIVVPRIDQNLQPLCAAYSKTSLPVLQAALDSGHFKLARVFDLLNTYYMPIEEIEEYGDSEMMFLNINTQEDYQKIKLFEAHTW